MTTTIPEPSAFADRLATMLDSGYRAALLVTGSSTEAQSALAEAAARAWRLTRSGAPAERLKVTFYRILLTACSALDRPFGRPAHEADLIAVGLDLGPLSHELARLSNAYRAAVVLDLVDEFQPDEMGEILSCPRATACALLHLGYEALRERIGGAITANVEQKRGLRSIPNGFSQDRVTVTKYWE